MWLSRGTEVGRSGVLLLALLGWGCGAPEEPVGSLAAAVDAEVPELDVSPGDLFFGLQCQAEAQVQTVRLRNGGRGELQVSGLRVSGSGFSLEAPPTLPALIASGGALEVGVKFEPMTNKIRRIEGKLQVRSNDPENRQVTIELGGMVQQPVIVATPRFLDFGERQTGAGCEMVEDVELSNLGRCPGEIRAYRVRGARASSVSVRGLVPGTLESEQSQRVQVVWSCQRRGGMEAVLNFLDPQGRAHTTTSMVGEAY